MLESLVSCKDCRWNVAEYLTNTIRVREEELRGIEERLKSITLKNERDNYAKVIIELNNEIEEIQKYWMVLLGTQYPFLF